jgi:FlaA1/EpsC-like NDP-sugar epimerase
MNRKQHYFAQLILTGDLVVLMVSYVVTYIVRQWIYHWTSVLLPMDSINTYAWLLPILIFSGLIALRYFELYDAVSYKSPSTILVALIKTQILAGLIVFSTMFLLTGWGTSRTLMGLFILVSYVLLAAEKLSIYVWMKYRSRLGRSTTSWKVLLVGNHAEAEKYLDLVLQHPDWNVEIVGIVPASLSGSPDGNGRGESHSTVEH